MSYDISIVDEKGKLMQSPIKHDIQGGTYCVGGTTDLWLSITSNYAKFFCRAFQDERGIKTLHGRSVLYTIPRIKAAIMLLGDDTTDNYWDATEGNAKKALVNLLQLAALGCDGYWSVEY